MPFKSESILKFGSSSMSFAVVTLLSYSMQSEKMGAFDYRRKEVVSLEGLFSQKGVEQPVAEHFKDVKNLLDNSVDFVDLKLNDISYGKARFISFNFPTSVNFDENAISLSKFTIQLEIIKEDANSYAESNLPTSVSTLNSANDWSWFKLKDFSENFSFRLGEDGNFEASHSLSFGYDPGATISDANLSTAAAAVANGFFKQALASLSSVNSLYSSADFQSSVSDYGSSLTEQSVDLINYKFAYSKNYTVFSQNGTNTSETITTEVSYKDDGTIEVSEKGRIKGKGASYATARDNAIAKLNANLLNAYTRCNSSFNTYFVTNYATFVGVIPKYNSLDILQSNPVSITKDLTDITPEVGYEIKFTTSSAYSNATSVHTYSIVLKKDGFGVYEVSKDGSIKLYTNKKKNFINNISIVKTIINNNDLSEINPYYQKISGSVNNYTGIKTASTITFAKFGVETTYSKTYSDSPTLRASGLGVMVRKLTTTESSQNPVNKFSTVKLMGSSSSFGKIALGKEIIYQTKQLSEGSRSITLEMKIDREQLYNGSANGVNTSAAKIFAKIKDLFTYGMLDGQSGYLFSGNSPLALSIFAKIYKDSSFNLGELTYFLDDLKLSIDNNYTLKVDLVFKFLVAKEQL